MQPVTKPASIGYSRLLTNTRSCCCVASRYQRQRRQHNLTDCPAEAIRGGLGICCMDYSVQECTARRGKNDAFHRLVTLLQYCAWMVGPAAQTGLIHTIASVDEALR